MAETEAWIEVVKAGVDLIRVVVWPSAVVSLALIFKSPLSDLLAALQKFELKAAACRFGISVTRPSFP